MLITATEDFDEYNECELQISKEVNLFCRQRREAFARQISPTGLFGFICKSDIESLVRNATPIRNCEIQFPLDLESEMTPFVSLQRKKETS